MKAYINYGFITPENRPYYEILRNLRDRNGKRALKASHLKIIEYVGSMPRANGCFASNKRIREQTADCTDKTLRNNLHYLIRIGALVKIETPKGRTLKLGAPEGPVMSQTEFRAFEKNMPEYSYKRQEEAVNQAELNDWINSDEPKKAPLFLSETEENFTESEGKFYRGEAVNLAPILYKEPECIETITKNPPTQTLPPCGTEQVREVRERASLASWGAEQPRPNSDELSVRRELNKTFSKAEEPIEDGKFAEPVAKPKRKRGVRTVKTQKERQQQAQTAIDHGHIGNPLGGPNNRPSRLNPKQARDIDGTRQPTISMLYKHLLKIYNRVFGEGVLETMISTDKSAVESAFGDIKQCFIDHCEGYEPDNHVMAEYFNWFFEETRLAGMLSLAKVDKNKVVHFRQLLGTVYIRKFYDSVVRPRLSKQPTRTSVETELIDDLKRFWMDAFKELKLADSDEKLFVRAMVQFGYAATAQYLHEQKGMTDSQCKQRIIDVMSGFIKTVSEPKNAVKYLEIGLEATEQQAPYLDKECVWYEWKPRTQDLIKIAIDQSGIQL